MFKTPATIKGALIRGLIGIALIIINVASGRYIFAILGALFLLWMVVNLIRHHVEEASSSDIGTASSERPSSRR
jgi:threonine/homoserine/homoserine lactone efflux protein